jgi:hypothetical protein
MTVLAAGTRARTMDVQEGDVGYIPQSNPRYIENTGDTGLVLLEMFDGGHYEDISLAEWMAHTPHQLIDQHLHVVRALIDAIPKRRDGDHPGYQPAESHRFLRVTMSTQSHSVVWIAAHVANSQPRFQLVEHMF